MTRHRGHPLSLSCLIAEASRQATNLKVEIFAASAAALYKRLSLSLLTSAQTREGYRIEFENLTIK